MGNVVVNTEVCPGNYAWMFVSLQQNQTVKSLTPVLMSSCWGLLEVENQHCLATGFKTMFPSNQMLLPFLTSLVVHPAQEVNVVVGVGVGVVVVDKSSNVNSMLAFVLFAQGLK